MSETLACSAQQKDSERTLKRGLDYEPVVFASVARISRAKAEPRFANPDDPLQAWSGRGKHPAWMRQQIENGGKKDDLLIK
jgi:DNA-binding protein H-NS